jgi:dipeptidase E
MSLNLVLYSDQIARQSDAVDARLLELLPKRARIGYLPAGPDRAPAWFRLRARHYARYDLSLSYFGVEAGFDPLRVDELLECDAIHLSGGNTFRFMHWLRVRGLNQVVQRFAARGGVLIGVSAGAIITTPDIGTAALCGDPRYPAADGDQGLGLVGFGFFPHFDGSDAHLAALREYSRAFPGEVYGVPDGSGIIVRGGALETAGPVARAVAGTI